MLSRADDDTDGLLYEDRRWSWREVVARGARARRAARRELRRPGPFHVGVLLENVPEFVFLLTGRGARRRGGRRHQSDPPRRRARSRHQSHRLPADRHRRVHAAVARRDPARPPARAHPRHRRPGVGSSVRGRGASRRPRRARCDRGARSRDAVRVAVHVGFDGRAQGRADDAGRARRVPSRTRCSRRTTCCIARCRSTTATRSNANLFPALRSGATIALRRKFSASAFLPDVQRYGVTFFNTVGRALNHILSTPETANDRNHSIKYVLGPETAPADVRAFRKRFGAPVIEGYGSSENAIILVPGSGVAEGLARPAARRHRRRDPRSGDGRGEAAGALRRARQAVERGRSDRRAGEPQLRRRASRATTTIPRPTPSAPATAGTGRATSATATKPACSGSPAATPTGSGSTARTSRPHRSSASSPGFPGPTASPCTRCPTAGPATR